MADSKQVPQWMTDASREIRALKPNYSDARDYAQIIAKHAETALTKALSNGMAVEEQSKVDQRRAEIARLKKLLCDLTPSGSEFFNDPERCAEFVRHQRNTTHKLLIRFKKERDAAVSALREREKETSKLDTDLHDAQVAHVELAGRKTGWMEGCLAARDERDAARLALKGCVEALTKLRDRMALENPDSNPAMIGDRRAAESRTTFDVLTHADIALAKAREVLP